MRDAARHEGTCAGPTDRDIVADLERDLAAQDIGHLVAVVMQVERALRPGGTVSSNTMMLPPVAPPSSLSTADRPGDMFHRGPSPGSTTTPCAPMADPPQVSAL
jgi:hypothetical protein